MGMRPLLFVRVFIAFGSRLEVAALLCRGTIYKTGIITMQATGAAVGFVYLFSCAARESRSALLVRDDAQ